MERWLSWSKAHDWKSCNGLYPFEGSNPSLSEKRNRLERVCFLFFREGGGLRIVTDAHLFKRPRKTNRIRTWRKPSDGFVNPSLSEKRNRLERVCFLFFGKGDLRIVTDAHLSERDCKTNRIRTWRKPSDGFVNPSLSEKETDSKESVSFFRKGLNGIRISVT